MNESPGENRVAHLQRFKWRWREIKFLIYLVNLDSKLTKLTTLHFRVRSFQRRAGGAEGSRLISRCVVPRRHFPVCDERRRAICISCCSVCRLLLVSLAHAPPTLTCSQVSPLHHQVSSSFGLFDEASVFNWSSSCQCPAVANRHKRNKLFVSLYLTLFYFITIKTSEWNISWRHSWDLIWPGSESFQDLR